MPLSKDDRIAFSLQIVNADAQVKGIDLAKAQLQAEIEKLQKLDTANKNLFDPYNILTNSYQAEINLLDGILRTTFTEQDIQNSANKTVGNFFYPNVLTVTVPSLAATNNIWTKIKPFALGYAIGKNYSEGNGTIQKEGDLITTALGYITAAGANTDIENTTGQQCTGTPPDTIVTFPAVQTLKTDLVNNINALKTFILNEATVISAIVDSDPTRSAQNTAALNDINNVIIPALNLWLGYVDFNTSHGQTTCAGFNGYNANLLAPTKLHSVQLAALQSALTARSAFITTRIGQLTANLGNISQDISTGELISSSGLYGQRYNFLLLRLNLLGGTLNQLVTMQNGSAGQGSMRANILNNKAIYMSIVPTSILAAPGNGTATINVVNASLFAPGDTVWIMAEGQEELQRGIKSVAGTLVVLNDIIPAKYRPGEKARIYKDLT